VVEKEFRGGKRGVEGRGRGCSFELFLRQKVFVGEKSDEGRISGDF